MPAATGTTAASEASGATTLIGPIASARYSAAKPSDLGQAGAGRDQHRIGRRWGLARHREQDEQEHQASGLGENQHGEHGQAPRDQTGQEVGTSPRDARPEREPESDHAHGA